MFNMLECRNYFDWVLVVVKKQWICMGEVESLIMVRIDFLWELEADNLQPFE